MRGLHAVSPVAGVTLAGMGDIGGSPPAVHLAGPGDIQGEMPEGPCMRAWSLASSAPTVEKRIEEAQRIFRESGWKAPAPYPGRGREEFNRWCEMHDAAAADAESKSEDCR